MENRAAQFAPFAALTGHDAAIVETARLTTEKPELSLDELDKLSRRLNYAIEKDIIIRITFFQPDVFKQGGLYQQVTGNVRKIDEIENVIILMDQRSIRLDYIISIESDQFDDIEL